MSIVLEACPPTAIHRAGNKIQVVYAGHKPRGPLACWAAWGGEPLDFASDDIDSQNGMINIQNFSFGVY